MPAFYVLLKRVCTSLFISVNRCAVLISGAPMTSLDKERKIRKITAFRILKTVCFNEGNKLPGCCLEWDTGGSRNSDVHGRRCGYPGCIAAIVDEWNMSVGHWCHDINPLALDMDL